MSQSSSLLDPFSFPLQGTHLIEASAGTGKTYTITSLYLRLLLGHGDLFTGFGRPLGVSEILLVTFTEAATQELKGRIRTRINQAKQAFLKGSAKGDVVLETLLKEFPKQSYPPLVRHLNLAEQQMDEAAIYTIHGFCQRMLKQNAFECNVLFDMNVLKDEQDLRETASLDFWRETMYPLAPQHAAVVQQYWQGPHPFMLSIGPLLEREGLCISPALDEKHQSGGAASLIAETLDKWGEKLQLFKQNWQAARPDLLAIIQQSDVSKRSYTKKRLPDWLSKVDAFCDDKHAQNLPDALGKFSQHELHEKTTKGQAPVHPIFEEIETLLAEPLPLKALIQHVGILDIRQRLKALKAQQQVFGFSDLLSQLNDTLHSDFGPNLSARIRTLHPVAMIDEFQDTDLTQYGIFERIYFNAPKCGVYLIGDPKQAIYSFRNADIFTYMRAKQEVSEHYHLDTNWRSTHAMVEATNQLFEFSKKPFIYDDAIPFMAVCSGGKSDKTPLRTQESKEHSAALQFILLEGDGPFNKQRYRQHQAEYCANEIVRLLNAGVTGQATIAGKALANEDIAVLVRNRTEAALIQQELEHRNVDAVYLSSKEGVFGTQEAKDLYLLMAGVASVSMGEPGWGAQSSVKVDEQAIRSALCTHLFNYTQDELESRFFDESQWENILIEFSFYQNTWCKQGVLPMLHQVFQRGQVMKSLQQAPNAERRLTNILHLAELLQHAASEFSGEKELLVWFLHQIDSQNQAPDDALLRLDSDRKRVQIVTIHKSKGLEYPIVFIPFACSYKATTVALYQDEQQNIKRLDLDAGAGAGAGNDDKAIAKADKERLAEDLRLIYVALTRSIYRCYLGVADVGVSKKDKSQGSYLAQTALGYLLLDENNNDLSVQLNKLKENSAHISLRHIDPEAQQTFQTFIPAAQNPAALAAKHFSAKIERDWRVSSFTALTRNASHKVQSLSEQLDLDALQDAEKPVAGLVNNEAGRTLFSFPKGAQAGTLMHTLFENIDFTQVVPSALHSLIDDQLLLAGFDKEWREVLAEMIQTVLQAPLNAMIGCGEANEHSQALSLNQIPNNKRFVELEFTLPIAVLESHTLQNLEQQLQPNSRYGRLEFMPQRGYLKGFIDLIFEWEGQYYILDYKSNHLGDSFEDYQPDKLNAAMAEHHYTLQYLLYSLALHRYLKHRVPDYDYHTHFGGVYYLFLRGINQDQPGNGIHFSKPAQSIIVELEDEISNCSQGVVDA